MVRADPLAGVRPADAEPAATDPTADRRSWIGAVVLVALVVLVAEACAAADGRTAVSQSIVWLPTGVAIAGLWLLGPGRWWAVAAGVALHRVGLDYDTSVIVPQALGSAAEALLGVAVLRRLDVRPGFERLHDVLGLFAAAAAAPLASIALSMVGRAIPGTQFHELGMVSGWAGWWRMNAIGTLTVVPLALTWSQYRWTRVPLRTMAEAAAVPLVSLIVLWLVMTTFGSAPVGIPLLHAVLAFALYAAVRFGPRGATAVASSGAAFVALATAAGIGPFLDAAPADRHAGAQIFELTLVSVPLVFGALIAERTTNAERSRELEGQLRQVQRLESVGRLAGGVAHDFNNLLTVMLGYAEALRGMLPDAVADSRARETMRDHLDEIRFAARRGANLTRQLLAFSRQQVLAPQTLDLTVVVREVSTMLDRLIGEHIALDVSGDPGAFVRADRGQLEQVLLNLAVNARDAMEQGGRLTITVRTAELAAVRAAALGLPVHRVVELVVADDGAGMTPAVQARAFEPFFTTKVPGKGTGLGLATVYGIVRQSGGAILLESAPGVGTTCRIYLPQVSAQTAIPQPASTDAAIDSTGTLLLVEDEPAVRELAARALRLRGHTVLTAADGEDALRLAAAHGAAIDLLVTDVVMPRLGGLALARELLRARPGLGVLFVSGYAADVTGMALGGFPLADFLNKPYDGEHLAGRIAALLARQQEARRDA